MDNSQIPPLPTTLSLSSGQTVIIRLIRPSDAPLLVDMFHHLSKRTRRLRFHAYAGNLPHERIWREAIALSDLDPARQVAVVAVHDGASGEHIVGVARAARATDTAVEAEAAVVVRDDFQRQGLGTRLLIHLLPILRSMNVEQVFGWVMAENKHMLQIIQKTSLPIHLEHHSGEMFVVISLRS